MLGACIATTWYWLFWYLEFLLFVRVELPVALLDLLILFVFRDLAFNDSLIWVWVVCLVVVVCLLM